MQAASSNLPNQLVYDFFLRQSRLSNICFVMDRLPKIDATNINIEFINKATPQNIDEIANFLRPYSDIKIINKNIIVCGCSYKKGNYPLVSPEEIEFYSTRIGSTLKKFLPIIDLGKYEDLDDRTVWSIVNTLNFVQISKITSSSGLPIQDISSNQIKYLTEQAQKDHFAQDYRTYNFRIPLFFKMIDSLKISLQKDISANDLVIEKGIVPDGLPKNWPDSITTKCPRFKVDATTAKNNLNIEINLIKPIKYHLKNYPEYKKYNYLIQGPVDEIPVIVVGQNHISLNIFLSALKWLFDLRIITLPGLQPRLQYDTQRQPNDINELVGFIKTTLPKRLTIFFGMNCENARKKYRNFFSVDEICTKDNSEIQKYIIQDVHLFLLGTYDKEFRVKELPLFIESAYCLFRTLGAFDDLSVVRRGEVMKQSDFLPLSLSISPIKEGYFKDKYRWEIFRPDPSSAGGRDLLSAIDGIVPRRKLF
jgi:hypothetical protein